MTVPQLPTADPGKGLKGEGPHRTLAPLAPSAGCAAGSQICLGRLLPALYLKLGTFFPSPFSAISPLPPAPDLRGSHLCGQGSTSMQHDICI